ncbi:glycoside hydrolase family 97 protein [Spirosoma knui]
MVAYPFKRYVFIPLLVLCGMVYGAPRPFQRSITSPDGRITLVVAITDSVRLSVNYDRQQLVNPSAIAMALSDGRVLGVGAQPRRSRILAVRDSILAPVATKRRVVTDQYTALRLTFRDQYSLEFRAYNDGVAYRFSTSFPDSITIRNETAHFTFANNPIVYYPTVQPRSGVDRFHTSFEEPYQIQPMSQMPDTALCFSPVLLAPASGPRIVLTESDLLDYPGMFLARRGTSLTGVFAHYPLAERLLPGEFPQWVVSQRASFIARTIGTRTFPWRVLVIGSDRDLPASDLVYRLATPSRLTDVSWIRPGKCTDEWITNINLFNVPFRAGINTATYKYYVDWAKRFGFDRILLDAGWSDYQDLFKITPGLDIPELVAYARSQGIRLSMWTLAATLDRQLEPALKQFQSWGVDFIMTDFMDRDDQKMVNFYTRVAEACAKAKIMIMYHGAYKPAGFERTYPHAITREGVLGSEYNIWSSKPTPDHDVLLPFIRMVSGPMDYEPGLLNNATKEQFRPIAGQVMSQGTRCHQLAMFVVYDSPMPIFSGNPSQALLEPRFMDFLGRLPTTYDDTQVLDAQLGEYIVTGRRLGNDWFVGALTNWTARDVSLPLSFLGAGTYEVIGCLDGINADRNPVDYQFTQRTVTRADSLNLHMAQGGGFVLQLKKK